MLILDTGCENVTLELSREDMDWLAAGCRVAASISEGWPCGPRACAPRDGIAPEEAARRHTHFFNVLTALSFFVDNDTPADDDEDAEPEAEATPNVA